MQQYVRPSDDEVVASAASAAAAAATAHLICCARAACSNTSPVAARAAAQSPLLRLDSRLLSAPAEQLFPLLPRLLGRRRRAVW